MHNKKLEKELLFVGLFSPLFSTHHFTPSQLYTTLAP